MWGAILFLIAILLVTPAGHVVADEWASQIIMVLGMGGTGTYIAFAVGAVSALVCFLVMRTGRMKSGSVYLVRQEVHGEDRVTTYIQPAFSNGRLPSSRRVRQAR